MLAITIFIPTPSPLAKDNRPNLLNFNWKVKKRQSIHIHSVNAPQIVNPENRVDLNAKYQKTKTDSNCCCNLLFDDKFD